MDDSNPDHTADSGAEGSGWAYGFNFRGLPDARLLLPPPAQGSWPGVRLRFRAEPTPGVGASLTDDRAVVELLDDEVAVMDRSTRTATLQWRGSHPDGRVVHPFLTAVATTFAWWGGHDAFHGGAFARRGEAWALLGDREAGKSSLLAALSLGGHPVLSDDLLVVDAARAVYAGPRCVDLRPGASAALGVGERVTSVRAGTRFRLEHLSVAHQVPLRGWVALGWSDRLELHPLQPSQRLHHLARHRSFPPTDPGSLVELARLPGFQLLRPRRWSSLEATVDALLDLTAR